jgi:hypothetical protein
MNAWKCDGEHSSLLGTATATEIEDRKRTESPQAEISTDKRAWSDAFPGAHLGLDLWRYADFTGLIPPWKPDR